MTTKPMKNVAQSSNVLRHGSASNGWSIGEPCGFSAPVNVAFAALLVLFA
jgi:hypothetical protein